MRIYSEHGEDKWIADHGLLPANGFYVDIGAMRPDQNSNTGFLRERGWQGLAIDGHPGCAQWWTEVAANFRVAILAGEQSDVLFEFGSPGRESESRIRAGGTPIPESEWDRIRNHCVSRWATTLPTVLGQERVEKIDFLSIDIEGAEFDVMRPLDLSVYKPLVIVAEYDTRGIGKDYRLMELLLATGYYSVVHQTPANLIYVRQ